MRKMPRKTQPRKPKAIPAHLVPVGQLCQNIVLSHHLLSDALRDVHNQLGQLRTELSVVRLCVEAAAKAVKKPAKNPA